MSFKPFVGILRSRQTGKGVPLEDNFRNAFNQFSNLTPQEKKDVEGKVSAVCRNHDLPLPEPDLVNAGRHVKIECVEIQAPENLKVRFPVETPEEIIDGRENWIGETFNDAEWLFPPFIGFGYVSRLAWMLRHVEIEEKEKTLELGLSYFYTTDHIAAMLLNRFPSIEDFVPFIRIISQSVKAFYLRMYAVSISSLITVIEGIGRNLWTITRTGRDRDPTGYPLLETQINSIFEHILDTWLFGNNVWIPSEYKKWDFLDKVDETTQILAGLKRYFERYLFASTSNYSGESKLNRHGILHGLSEFSDFDRPINFYRIWSVLEAFAFTCATKGIGSMFAPDPNNQSMALASLFTSLEKLLERDAQ